MIGGVRLTRATLIKPTSFCRLLKFFYFTFLFFLHLIFFPVVKSRWITYLSYPILFFYSFFKHASLSFHCFFLHKLHLLSYPLLITNLPLPSSIPLFYTLQQASLKGCSRVAVDRTNSGNKITQEDP